MEPDAGPLPPQQLDECRICRDTSPPLRHPCLCRGSMRFVHEACLQQWLEHRRQGRRCEVCGVAFRWTPSYAPDTPTRLPLTDLTAGLLRRLGRVGRTTWRVLLSTLVWLSCVPLCTTWLWRLSFSQSLSSAGATLRWSWSSASVVADCLGGTLLSACIVFVLLALASLRDTLRALQHEQRLLAGALHNAGQQPGHPDEPGALRAQPDPQGALPPQLLGDDGPGDGQDGGLWGPPGVGDAPLGIQELIGVEGPVAALVENAATVLASNAIFLCVAIFLPFTVGRLALVAAHMGVNGSLVPAGGENATVAAATYRQSLVKAMTMQSPLSASLLSSNSNATEAGLAAGAGAAGVVNGTAASPPTLFALLASTWDAHHHVGAPPSVGDVLTLLVGYALMAATATLWLCVVCAWHVRRSANGGVHLIVARQAMAAVLTTLVSAKVVFLLFIELGAFPLAAAHGSASAPCPSSAQRCATAWTPLPPPRWPTASSTGWLASATCSPSAAAWPPCARCCARGSWPSCVTPPTRRSTRSGTWSGSRCTGMPSGSSPPAPCTASSSLPASGCLWPCVRLPRLRAPSPCASCSSTTPPWRSWSWASYAWCRPCWMS